ncbi:MAG TPA: hypothetical protein VMM37_07445 [Bacteroidota bacterium]|nr:hypothetical protein [Bacteroidota bacterium]
MRPSHVCFIVFLLVLSSVAVGQNKDMQLFNRLARGKEQVRPDELVSFKNDYPYLKAIKELSDLAKKFTGKIIVDTSPIKADETKVIGTNIQTMYWKDALEVILRANDNWYDENPDYFLVYGIKEGKKEVAPLTQPGETQAAAPGGAVQGGGVQGGAALQAVVPVDSSKAYAEMKEVTVSAILLDVNQTKLRENGISFSIFRGSNVNLNFQFTGAASVTPQPVQGAITVNPTSPNLAVDVNAAINFFENEGYGEVVARPVLRIRAGGTSSVQIGQSISILTKDFSGNTTQQFVDAGTILQVWPKTYMINGTPFIYLAYHLDQSVPTVSTSGTAIDHKRADGSLLMLDGERTYVSGLITSTQDVVRQGVPLLKDLPWWVFGLRYIFGYEQVNVIKRELIMIIDAKLEPTVEERIASETKNNEKSALDKAKQMREGTETYIKKRD